MAFNARTRAEIRDALLADWSARYQQLGKTLLTIQGSDAYMLAEALALELEGLEAQALQLTHEILPDEASTEFLDRHGSVDGVARVHAVAAVLSIEISGTPNATVTFGSSVLVSTAGLRYTPSSATKLLDGAGKGTLNFTCTTAGTTGNQADLAVLTWSSTPTDANPTATVQSTVTAGADAELDAAYATRIVQRRQERPASGNRADWRQWVRDCTGVLDAYVYPLLHPSLGAGTLGAVTVLGVGPVQGDSTTNTRVLDGSKLTDIAAYLEGTKDPLGNTLAAAAQKMLRPVTMAAGDYAIEAVLTSSQNVDATLVMASAYAFPFTGTMTEEATVGSTTTVLYVNGDQTAKNGKAVLVKVGTSNIRGGYQMITLPNGTFGGVYTTFNLTTPLVAAPVASSTVYPAPPNWPQIRAAVFAYFDSLGPGDTSPAARWPGEESQGRATLYRSALAAVLIDGLGDDYPVTGVLSASVGTPAGDVAPAAKTVVTLGEFVVHA
jgi:hypothetical protein